MKKLLYLLLLLPLGFFASCSDDKDLPSVDITVNIENAVDANGKIYIVEGEPLTVAGIDVKSLNGKASGISGVNYVLDHVGIGYNIVQPFGGTISANLLPAGNHLLTLAFDVLQVDKSIAYAQLSTVVTVVPAVEDLPEGSTLGNVALTYHLNPQN
ncbi:MAG: hypothetical protein K2M93_08230 [Muribaculaceae bacterium]|nr:hypothetical protein [Muribaculaceae bacterium]